MKNFSFTGFLISTNYFFYGFATLFSIYFCFSGESDFLTALAISPLAFMVGLFLSIPVFMILSVILFVLDLIKALVIAIYELFTKPKANYLKLPEL